MSLVSDTLRGVRPFFLLIIFFILSIIAFFEEDLDLLKNPVSLKAFYIPLIGLLAYGLAVLWVDLVSRISAILPAHDRADLGYLVACSLMVLVILITFSYLAHNHRSLSFMILVNPGFIYTVTLFFASRVAFEVSGS